MIGAFSFSEDNVSCEKCGKKYRLRGWLMKHMESHKLRESRVRGRRVGHPHGAHGPTAAAGAPVVPASAALPTMPAVPAVSVMSPMPTVSAMPAVSFAGPELDLHAGPAEPLAYALAPVRMEDDPDEPLPPCPQVHLEM